MDKITTSVPGYTFCSPVVLYGIGVSSTNGKWGEAWLLTHLFFLSFTVVLTITFDLVPTTPKEIPMIGKRYKAFADPEWGRGSGFYPTSHWKNTKLKDFLAILVPITWKISKLPSQH